MRALRSLTIRARITLGSLVIGAVVLAGIAVVLHLQVAAATAASDRALAEGDAAPFVSDLRHNPDEPPDRPASGVLVGIRDTEGRFVVDTLPDDVREYLPARVDDDETVLRVHVHRGTFTLVGYRVGSGGAEHEVWAARDGRSGRLTVDAVDRSLVVGTIVALAAFGGTAWLLTTLSLRPVARMRRTAEALSGERSAEHLPVADSDDELADLARTLNAFLDRQRTHAEQERRMVSDASHELRTPLAALTARLELAHRYTGDAAALERELGAAEDDAARLARLADTLLELSRLDAADDGVDGAPTDSATPAREVVTELMGAVDRARLTPGAADLDLDFSVHAPDAGVQYPLSAASFGRVVDNLVANAVAFSPTGGAVRLALRQETDGALALTVTDEGPGLPDTFLPHAFERFARADEARRRTGTGGSGLGLALVRGIAERAGGTATIRNRATGGAEATVRLPAVGGSREVSNESEGPFRAAP